MHVSIINSREISKERLVKKKGKKREREKKNYRNVHKASRMCTPHVLEDN